MPTEACLILFVAQGFKPKPSSRRNFIMKTYSFSHIKKHSALHKSYFLLLLMAGLTTQPAFSQRTKGPLELAEQYFAEGEYYTAAFLYEQYLHPPKKQKEISQFPLNAKGKRSATVNTIGSKTDVLFKQAHSYRLANYWPQAAALYKECIAKDSVQYADAYYWQAICERSLAHYSTANDLLKRYLSFSNASLKTDAESEIKRLAFIKKELSRADSILFTIKKINTLNSKEAGLFAVANSGNTWLVSSTEKDTVITAGTNPYQSRLYYASMSNGSIDNLTPLELPNTNSNQGAATISKDGKHLYFTQWKKEKGQTVSAIYHSVKQDKGWSTPAIVSSINMTGFNSKQPYYSIDGKYLFFASDRPGGAGKFDIWYAPINADGSIGQPVNAGSSVNTTADEQAPFYQSSSSTLVFSSNGHEGMGGYDLFSAKNNSNGFASVTNLGNPVNSSRDDIYFYTKENTALLSNVILSSDRGDGCCLETYQLTKASKSRQLTGTILDCESNKPLADVSVTLRDNSGKTWKTITNANGKYLFDMKQEAYGDLVVSLTKEKYVDTLAAFSVRQKDESDLLKDVFTNTDLCIHTVPEPPKLVIKAEDVITVFFDFDRHNLKPAAIEKLDSIYMIVQENPKATIQISGYTDGLGSDEYNKILSDKRAKACADYLIKKGINPAIITFESFGACCPIEMEKINGRDNAEGRSKNRRALINVKKE